MKITKFGAHRALSFTELDCPVNPTLNIITGPNAVGKTSLARIIDIVIKALTACYTQDWRHLEEIYGRAGHYGASPWSVRLGIAFEDEDLNLFDDWVRASLISYLPSTQNLPEQALTGLILDAPDLGTAAMFARGEFVVNHDQNRRWPWQVMWRADVSRRGETQEVTLRLNSGNLLHISGTPERSTATISSALRDAVLEAQLASGMAAGEHKPVPDTFRIPAVLDLAARGGIELHVAPTGSEPELDPVRRVMAAVDAELYGGTRNIGFAEVAHKLLVRALSVTANHRLPPETLFSIRQLAQDADLTSGVNLALALYQDKNSESAAHRERFAYTQKLFAQLTSSKLRLDVTSRMFLDPQGDSGDTILLTPIVTDSLGDVPLHLSGAGRAEAAHLAAVLARDWPCLLLDEPATNISSTAQGQVLQAVRDRTSRGRQTLLITHSSHLVPAAAAEDLTAVLRLAPAENCTKVYRPGQPEELQALLPRLRLVHVRDALFAAGVLLVEGNTDAGLARVWFEQQATPTAAAANILIISVDSETGFSPHMRLMDKLGVPWAVLADGPALYNSLPRYNPAAPSDDFEAAKRFWREQGVFTLAEEFGIGERRGHGEIEKFLRDYDSSAFELASNIGGRSKPRVGEIYAHRVPMPPQFAEIWSEVVSRFHIS